MILEMDCGNSFIKWRVVDGLKVVGGGVVDSGQELVAALLANPLLHITSCRLVSVRSDEETASLITVVSSQFSVAVKCASPAKVMAGVTNGYEHFERLGLDRWLALVGAYELSRRACLVLDLGTAVTADFVARDGKHLGGFICPGLPLMRNQLRTHTRRIRYDTLSAEQALQRNTPGRTTVEAVERGCLMMLRGFVLSQLELAGDYWGEDYEVFLTGGDADLVASAVPDGRLVKDLVFIGLAAACPI